MQLRYKKHTFDSSNKIKLRRGINTFIYTDESDTMRVQRATYSIFLKFDSKNNNTEVDIRDALKTLAEFEYDFLDNGIKVDIDFFEHRTSEQLLKQGFTYLQLNFNHTLHTMVEREVLPEGHIIVPVKEFLLYNKIN